jgi:hypothetical protein
VSTGRSVTIHAPSDGSSFWRSRWATLRPSLRMVRNPLHTAQKRVRPAWILDCRREYRKPRVFFKDFCTLRGGLCLRRARPPSCGAHEKRQHPLLHRSVETTDKGPELTGDNVVLSGPKIASESREQPQQEASLPSPVSHAQLRGRARPLPTVRGPVLSAFVSIDFGSSRTGKEYHPGQERSWWRRGIELRTRSLWPPF